MILLGLLAAIVVAFMLGYYTGLNTCRKEKSDILDD